MARTVMLLMLLFVGFILNGVVPFTLFLISGLIYAIGATLQIVVLLASLIVGGLLFSAIGLATGRYGEKIGILMLIGAAASSVYVFLMLRESAVLTVEQFGMFSLLNMSSNAVISHSVSRFSHYATGKLISLKHFSSIGVGSPAVFFILFFVYVYIDYSNLPLIALISECFAIAVSAVLLRHVMLNGHYSRVGGEM